MIFGIDISNWQIGVNYNVLKQNGIDFAIIKSTEGEGFKDGMFNTHLNGCKNAGMIVAAYHYVRGGNADAQFSNIKSIVPKSVPVILDIEDGAGDMNSIRRLLVLLQKDGYKTPLIYIPEWYWNKIGKPSLSGLPANWWSWYPDNSGQTRTFYEGISMVPSRIWNGFGGLPVQIIQFTSTGRVLNSARQPVGYNANLDLNAFRGSVEDLYNLFSQKSQSGGGGDTMSATDAYNGVAQMFKDMAAGNANDLVAAFHTFATQYGMPKAPDLEISADGSNRTTIHDEVRWLSANFASLNDRLEKIEQRVDSIKVGGIDYDRIAEAILSKIDVDIVRRPSK